MCVEIGRYRLANKPWIIPSSDVRREEGRHVGQPLQSDQPYTRRARVEEARVSFDQWKRVLITQEWPELRD